VYIIVVRTFVLQESLCSIAYDSLTATRDFHIPKR
jgi:hypothetical protein